MLANYLVKDNRLMVQKVKLLKTFLLAFNSKKPAFISVEEKKSGTKESKSSWHTVR